MGQARNNAPQAGVRGCASNRQDLGFPSDGRKLYTKIKATPSQRIAESADLIGCQDDEWNCSVFDRSKLRNGNLPFRQDLQQEGFESFVDFIDLVDQENTGFV